MKSSKLYKMLLENDEEKICFGCNKQIKNDNYIEYKGKLYHNDCASFMNLEENMGDNTDYSKKIELLVKKYWKNLQDKKLFDAIADIEIDVDYSNDEFRKPLYYRVDISTMRKGLNDIADNIGEYISDNIPSLKYEGYEDTKILDTDFGSDVTLKFNQPNEFKDFGSDFESENLREGYSLGDDKESFDIYDKNCGKAAELYSYLKREGLGDLVDLEISQDSIYKLVITTKGIDGNKLGNSLRADGYGDDYVIIDVNDALQRKSLIAEDIRSLGKED